MSGSGLLGHPAITGHSVCATSRTTMDEQAVRAFSSMHTCGDAQLGGQDDAFSGDHDAFFGEYAVGINRSIASEPGSPPVDCRSRSCAECACSPFPFSADTCNMVSGHGVLYPCSGHRRSPARDPPRPPPRRAASARAARRVPTRERRPRETEPTTRSRVCNDACPIRSDFSDSELVECYKRYLPCAWTPVRVAPLGSCGRSDLASGRRLLPVDRAVLFTAHVDASKKQSAVRGGSQARTDPPRCRRATRRRTCRQRARTSPQQPDANAAPDDAGPTQRRQCSPSAESAGVREPPMAADRRSCSLVRPTNRAESIAAMR